MDYDFKVTYTAETDGTKKYVYNAKKLLDYVITYKITDGEETEDSRRFRVNTTAIDNDEGFKKLNEDIANENIILAGDDNDEYNSTEADRNKYTYYIKTIQRKASADRFREENEGFLWVKNIWISDSPIEKSVFSSASKLKSKTQVKMTENDYNEITHDLAKEKKQPNGYFIMVILTIGVSVLSQFISTKSQKAQLELQSVDGRGAKQQKTMMIIMPILMAIFAFMYTTAFSIYIVFSSLFSTASTLIINYFVDLSFKKKKKEESKDNDKRVIGKTIIEEDKEKKE